MRALLLTVLFSLFSVQAFSFDRFTLLQSLDTIKREISTSGSTTDPKIQQSIEQIARQIDRRYLEVEALKQQNLRMQNEVASNPKVARSPKPDISIVIPCYNRSSCIAETINAIYDQDWNVPFEVIVIDDCSTDNTLDVLKPYEQQYDNFFVYVNERNLKAPETRNRGILRARAKYVFNIDSDDVPLTNTLPAFLKHVSSQHAGMGVFETLLFFNDFNYAHVTRANKIPASPLLDIHSIIDSNYLSYAAGNRLFEKAVWLNCGGYLDNDGHDSWSMSFRVLARGYAVDMVPNSVYYHRVWSNGESMYAQDDQNQRHLISPFLLILENSEIFYSIDHLVDYPHNKVMARPDFFNKPKDVFQLNLLPKHYLNLYFKACHAEDLGQHENAIPYLVELISHNNKHPRFIFHLLINAVKANNTSMALRAINLLMLSDLSRFEKEESLIKSIQKKSRKNYFDL